MQTRLIGRAIAGLCLAVAMAFASFPAVAAPTPLPAGVALLPDNLCPPPQADEIRVCGFDIRPADVVSLHGYARCISSRYPAEAEAAVRDRASITGQEELSRLVDMSSACAPRGRTRISGVLLQGAIAEALLAQARKSDAANLTPQPASPRADAIDCVVASDPRSAVDLLGSRPLSPRERQRMRILATRLPQCVPAGARLELSMLALRSLVALAAFDALSPPRPDDTVLSASLSLTLGQREQPMLLTRAIDAPAVTIDAIRMMPMLSIAPPKRQAIPDMFNETHRPFDLAGQYWEEDRLAAEAQPCLEVHCAGGAVYFRRSYDRQTAASDGFGAPNNQSSFIDPGKP